MARTKATSPSNSESPRRLFVTQHTRAVTKIPCYPSCIPPTHALPSRRKTRGGRGEQARRSATFSSKSRPALPSSSPASLTWRSRKRYKHRPPFFLEAGDSRHPSHETGQETWATVRNLESFFADTVLDKSIWSVSEDRFLVATPPPVLFLRPRLMAALTP